MALILNSCRRCRPSVRSSLGLQQTSTKQQSGTATSRPSAQAHYDSVQDYEDAMAASNVETAKTGKRRPLPWRPVSKDQPQSNPNTRKREVASTLQSAKLAKQIQSDSKRTLTVRQQSKHIVTLAEPENFFRKPDPVTPRVVSGIFGLQTGQGFVPVPGSCLRDACSCKSCRNPDTAQRQVNVFRNPAAVSIVKTDLQDWPSQMSVTFADGHTTTLPGSYIVERTSHKRIHNRRGIVQVQTWNSSIERDPPVVPYSDISNGSGMSELMLKIRQQGFCFVEDIPSTPEASQALLESIGPIRNTHYGGFYDFTSDLSSKDTAYTSEALEPHTDNTYFTEPAGLQALHLLSHTDGSGGESSLVDGFAAADQLRREDPLAYITLSVTGVHAHASGNEGISIQPAEPYPTLTHSNETSRLLQVRWNNADRAGVATSWPKLGAWYDAAAKFDAIINDKRNQYWFQLKPGRMLIFDNWRCLHGRAAFTGKRRMCGGYINRDDFISKFRATKLSAEELEASTVTG